MYNIYIHIYNNRSFNKYWPQISLDVQNKFDIMFCCYVCSSVLSFRGKCKYVSMYFLPVVQSVRFGQILYSSSFLGWAGHRRFSQLLICQCLVDHLAEQEVLSCSWLVEARWFWLSLSVLNLPDPFLRLPNTNK